MVRVVYRLIKQSEKISGLNPKQDPTQQKIFQSQTRIKIQKRGCKKTKLDNEIEGSKKV